MIRDRVIFKKPNFKELDLNCCYVDMHYHSLYSDTSTKVSTIIKKANKKGIGVAITDHNEIKGSIEASKNKEGVLVIPGIEIGSAEGPHLLVYFYSIKELEEFFNKHIKKSRGRSPFTRTKIKFGELIEHTKRYNCLACPAHPISVRHLNLVSRIGSGKINSAVLREIDALEVFCGQAFRKMNLFAMGLCEIVGKGYVGGSDGHVLSSLGSVLTYSSADSVNGFLDAVAKKRNHIIGKEMKLIPRLLPYSKQVNKHLKYLGGYLESHYELTKMLRHERRGDKDY